MTPADLIVKLLSSGSTLAVMVAIIVLIGLPGWAAWWWERRRSAQREDKLLELATAQVQAVADNNASIDSNTKVLEHLDRNIERYMLRE